jgi:hypothetical protein
MCYNIEKERRFYMINDYSNICSETMCELLDIFNMKDWQMTWEEFLIQFQKEILTHIEKWKKEF